MYHDQILFPLKRIFKFDAINFTLWIKYIEVIPDHGPVENIILKKKANPSSLMKCVKFLIIYKMSFIKNH